MRLVYFVCLVAELRFSFVSLGGSPELSPISDLFFHLLGDWPHSVQNCRKPAPKLMSLFLSGSASFICFVWSSSWRRSLFHLKLSLIPPRMPLHDLLQRDVFGEKLITITAENLNQTQINNFLQRMHEYETPGSLNIQRELYDSIQITKFLRALTARRRRRLPKHPGIRIMERT